MESLSTGTVSPLATQTGMALACMPIDKFSFGISDRGASIRIPIATVENGWNGWLEDRRPNSAADPYKVAARIIKTVKTVPEYALVNGR